MWFFYIFMRFFQLIILVMLSGVLFSIAAISRLMEITIMLIYPISVFLLRQSANLIILLIIWVARMISSALHKLCSLFNCNQQEMTPPSDTSQNTAELQLNMQTPFVPYERNDIQEIIQNIPLTVDESLTELSADERIIEPLRY